MEVLDRYGAKATISSCGRAVERSPWIVQDAVRRGHEISCHGYRWQSHARMSEAEVRADIERTVRAIRHAVGRAPVGWHTRSAASPHTRRLLVEHGGFLYDSDAYNDDLPYVVTVGERPHVVLPYAFDTNDMRFQPGGGFVHASDFARYCIDAFDRLSREGEWAPRMMSVGLHLRLIGRPARIAGLEAFLDHVQEKGGAWLCRRDEIARHWRELNGLPALPVPADRTSDTAPEEPSRIVANTAAGFRP
jgi:peptidoglycan/xylan/chitin deacetylase (PgdA/CDA1 family)